MKTKTKPQAIKLRNKTRLNPSLKGELGKIQAKSRKEKAREDAPTGKADLAQATNAPQATETPTDKSEVPGADNGNLVSVDELAAQINEFHVKAEASEQEALRNAWEAGVRLNQAFGMIKYGGWGKFLKENCPTLGLTTVWRYRRLADGYSTLEELAGLTLSEAYAKLGLATFEKERVPGDGSTSHKGGSGSNNKMPSPYAAVINDVLKASQKFDAPASLSQVDKAAVKRLCVTLEDVHGQNNMPSILGVVWQAKLDIAVEDWTEDERDLFEAEFARLEAIHKNVQAITEGA